MPIAPSDLKSAAWNLAPRLKEWRRHMHRFPELSFQEKETARFVANVLEGEELSFQSGIAGTGLVATLPGALTGKTIALRADMDALPIEEKNEVSYKSENPGVMHACGHDVHTACLLGAAVLLRDLQHELSGPVRLIFQPGEEQFPGGAKLMIEAGVLENPVPAAIIGQHVEPTLRPGQFGFRSGVYMASADEIYLTVVGKGGHAAMPHLLIDPVVATAQVIISLQQVVSRFAPPLIPSVLSFGKVQAAGATNVIPERVHLAGTFRTFDENWRNRAHELIEQIARQVAGSFGAKCEVDIKKGYPCLENNPSLTGAIREAAVNFAGKEQVVDLDKRMSSEDFAWYAQKVPACFYRLGTGNPEKGIVSPVHTSTFDIDEEALVWGAAMLAWLALSFPEN